MVLSRRHSLRVFFLVNMVIVMKASTSNSNCPINCECQPESYKVNCSAANLSATSLKQISDRTENLDLSRNEFTQLPEALFSYFENLVVLRLSFNKISFIHRYAFIRLDHLKNLDLSNNRIASLSAISAFIEGLNRLEILNLSENPLTSLGESADQILYSDSLLELYVSHCQINQVQGGLVFRGLVNLLSANLSHNPLTRIEGFFSSSLLSLDISESNIQFLHANTFGDVKYLRELRISNNQRLTDQYTKLSSPSISFLDASYCSLYSNYASDLPEAWTVILKGNLLRYISANIFENNSKLENLDLSNNRISYLDELAFNGAKSLQFLDLSTNFITTIPANTFAFTPRLIHLNLSSNPLHNLEAMRGLSFEYLDFSFCKIKNIAADALVQMPNLKVLNISYNFIEKLPHNFSSKSLRILNAAFCRLTTISKSNFHRLSELKEIDLSGNRLVYIKNTTFVGNNLHSLNLLNNLWKCDCRDENFLTFWRYLTQPVRISDRSMLICQYPENVTGWTWEDACSSEWSHDSKKRKDVIVLLIIVAILFVSGIVACVVAIREHWVMNRGRTRSNEELEHSGSVHEARGNAESEGCRAESIRKLMQLPSYDEALLLPKLSFSDDVKEAEKIKKRQIATQTDDSSVIAALLPEITKRTKKSQSTSEESIELESGNMKRNSWDQIEYINIIPPSVQCTEL